MNPIGRLHVLTDTMLQTRFSHEDLARLAVAGGADTIQYRQKAGSTREMIETATWLSGICKEAGVTLIVNDRVDVAIASGADGVHLGQDDYPVKGARQLLGANAVIGVTAKTPEAIRKGVKDGADYVGYGPVRATGSKTDAGDVKGTEGVRSLVESVTGELEVPVIAIGGIDATNAGDVLAAGAHGIAVLSVVCCSADPEAATRELRRAIGTI